jgi:hypothetical protein
VGPINIRTKLLFLVGTRLIAYLKVFCFKSITYAQEKSSQEE